MVAQTESTREMAEEEGVAMLNEDDTERQKAPSARFSVSRSVPDREDNAATDTMRTLGRMVMKGLSRKIVAVVVTFAFSSFLFALQTEVDGNRSRITNLKESSPSSSDSFWFAELSTLKHDLTEETKARTEADALAAKMKEDLEKETKERKELENALLNAPPTNNGAVATEAVITFREPRQWDVAEQISSGNSGGEVSRMWSPSALTVRVGDTVTWTWSTNENVIEATEEFGESTEPLFTSGDLRTGGTYSRKFEEPGVLRFISQNSMGLHGTITVLADTSISTAADRDGLEINGGIRVLPAGAGSLPVCDE